MKLANAVEEVLFARGVRVVFELVGGMTTHLVDAFDRRGRIRIVSMHHEQGAAFAADGFARVSGIPGVALATSGPGAINLLTGVGSCYFDSVPAVFITGQVNRVEQKGARAIRQLGFQETDIVSMAVPITKAAWRAHEPAEVIELLHKAFELAASGRPGPVLVDLPMDVQRADVAAELLRQPERSPRPADKSQAAAFDRVFGALRNAERPLILAGGGIRAARVIAQFRSMLERIRVPVVNSLMAVDVLPFQHELRVGLIGSYGNRWANLAIGRSDCILVLGSRLDIRQTGADTEAFKGDRLIFHVDVDAAEINNRVQGCVPIVADVRDFLDAARKASAVLLKTEWLGEIAALRAAWPDTSELGEMSGINPNQFIHDLTRASRAAYAVVVDVGQHQMWAAQSAELVDDQRLLTSGGMGAMGYALPAAVGAAMASPGNPLLVVAGDGGFQLNIQELQTIVRNNLPVKMVVLNNRCHGMVRQFQESYFESRYVGTLQGYSCPDFAAIAQAYGIPALSLTTQSEIHEAIQWLWRDPASPALLEVAIEPLVNVYPKIAFGRPITEMEPQAKPLAIEAT